MWKTLNPKYYQHLSWFFCIKFIPVLWNMKHWRAQSQLQASLVDVTIISHLSPAPLFPAVGPKISIIFINHRSHPAMIGLLMHMQKGWALKLKCGLYWHVRSESHFDVCVFSSVRHPFCSACVSRDYKGCLPVVPVCCNLLIYHLKCTYIRLIDSAGKLVWCLLIWFDIFSSSSLPESRTAQRIKLRIRSSRTSPRVSSTRPWSATRSSAKRRRL